MFLNKCKVHHFAYLDEQYHQVIYIFRHKPFKTPKFLAVYLSISSLSPDFVNPPFVSIIHSYHLLRQRCNQDKMIFVFQSYPYKRLRNIQCLYLRFYKTIEYFCCFHNSVQKVFSGKERFSAEDRYPLYTFFENSICDFAVPS